MGHRRRGNHRNRPPHLPHAQHRRPRPGPRRHHPRHHEHPAQPRRRPRTHPHPRPHHHGAGRRPQFHHISTPLTALLHGRTLVAHNADFDYGFLAAEAARARIDLPVDRLLCTVELAAALNLGLPNLRLATLANHYRIHQHRPHDALDDATVLAGVFRQLLTLATAIAHPLPIRPHRGATRRRVEDNTLAPAHQRLRHAELQTKRAALGARP